MIQGYIIHAINTDTIDYITCARVLAKSLRAIGDNRPITLLTQDYYDNDQSVFDQVLYLDADDVSHLTHGPYASDWQVYHKSPYDLTIKLEADMIITRSLDSWWTLLEHRELHIATGCRNYKQQISNNRTYRRINDQNHLPDCYNGITYFKKSRTAQQFFNIVREIFKNWSDVNKNLEYPTLNIYGDTDTVYAIAATIIGTELCTLPNNIIQWVHMKKNINNLFVEDWNRELVWELIDTDFRINTISQMYPVHYHVKQLATELEILYDRLIKV